jgi:phosphoenolpyruvate carboxylase
MRNNAIVLTESNGIYYNFFECRFEANENPTMEPSNVPDNTPPSDMSTEEKGEENVSPKQADHLLESPEVIQAINRLNNLIPSRKKSEGMHGNRPSKIYFSDLVDAMQNAVKVIQRSGQISQETGITFQRAILLMSYAYDDIAVQICIMRDRKALNGCFGYARERVEDRQSGQGDVSEAADMLE